MKTINKLLVASVLAATTGVTSASTWDLTMTSSTYVENFRGPVNIDYTGTYDDASKTGLVGGQIVIPYFSVYLTYQSQSFTMDPASGSGTLLAADPSYPNCTDNTGAACAGFSPKFMGSWYNAINYSYTTDNLGNKIDTSTGTPFILANGTFTWTLLIEITNPSTYTDDFVVIPFTIDLQRVSEVPTPAAGWLFMSGLIGLANTAHKRKSV